MKQQLQNSKGNINMEDIMRMNDILKPYQERNRENEEGNFDQRCYLVEVYDHIKYLGQYCEFR